MPTSVLESGVSTLPTACTHFDPYELTIESVNEVYRQLLTRCPVARSDRYGGFWVLSRYKDVSAALRDPGTYISGQGVHIPYREGHLRVAPLDFDPPDHTRYRNVITPPLSQQAVARLEDFIRGLIKSLVEPVVAKGGGEVIEEIAVPLPLQVISHILGLSPSASKTVRVMTERMWKEYEQMGDEARRPLGEFLLQEANDRRREPRDDYLTQLATGEADGKPLNDEELASILVALANAGHQTTLNAVGNTLLHLATHPEDQARVRQEPAIIPTLVEESLRFYPPVHMFLRTLTRDVVIDGTTMKAGDKVMLVYAAANRDPEQFPDPERFIMDRPANRHFAFGFGIHFCMGAPLARTELRILLEELAKHPPFTLAGVPTYSGMEGGHHLGVTYLPLAFSD